MNLEKNDLQATIKKTKQRRGKIIELNLKKRKKIRRWKKAIEKNTLFSNIISLMYNFGQFISV